MRISVLVWVAGNRCSDKQLTFPMMLPTSCMDRERERERKQDSITVSLNPSFLNLRMPVVFTTIFGSASGWVTIWHTQRLQDMATTVVAVFLRWLTWSIDNSSCAMKLESHMNLIYNHMLAVLFFCFFNAKRCTLCHTSLRRRLLAETSCTAMSRYKWIYPKEVLKWLQGTWGPNEVLFCSYLDVACPSNLPYAPF